MDQKTKQIINSWEERALSNPEIFGISFHPIVCNNGHLHLGYVTKDDQEFLSLTEAVRWELEKLWYEKKQSIFKLIKNKNQKSYDDIITNLTPSECNLEYENFSEDFEDLYEESEEFKESDEKDKKIEEAEEWDEHLDYDFNDYKEESYEDYMYSLVLENEEKLLAEKEMIDKARSENDFIPDENKDGGPPKDHHASDWSYRDDDDYSE